MAATDYVYAVSTDFANGVCNEVNLIAEIKASSIVTRLVGLVRNSDILTLTFENALTVGEKTTLDGDTSNPAGGLIAANDPIAKPAVFGGKVGDPLIAGDAGGGIPGLPSVATPQIIEMADALVQPEGRATGNSSRVCQTTYEGASFWVRRTTQFNRLILRVTGGTFSPVPTVKVLLYQGADGKSGVATLKATCSFGPTATGNYVITPSEGAVTLSEGVFYALFGRQSGTGGTATMRTYTVLALDLVNQSVDSGTHPTSFTTAIDCSTAPATLDPITQTTASLNDVCLLFRLKKV